MQPREPAKAHRNLSDGTMSDLFRKFAEKTSHAVGTPWAFLLAFAAVAIWALTGPVFGYSDTWQLIINTSTTIVTFLMVFLIQNTQNRDARIVNLKLDELLRADQGARTGLVKLDDMTDEQLTQVQHEFERLQNQFGSLVDDHVEHVRDTIKARATTAKKPHADQA